MLAKNNKPNSDNKANTKTLSSRLVIEKPFGKDSESCQKMMKDIAEAGWEQKEIYRVDHFAAIETVSRVEIPHGHWHDHFEGLVADDLNQHRRQIKQLPYLIFAQPSPFSPHSLLNKNHVQAVMIELKESFGCEGRGGYFDEFGIVRDVLQNRKFRGLSFGQ
jgi:glucose-6-phosphate 1-dehydrogenase